MKVEILFDKNTNNKRLHTGWGVSFLVDNRILFDTGENGSWLVENIGSLNIHINTIEAVVISHDHWDHTEGLWEILKKKKGLTVYACPHFKQEFKDKVKTLHGTLIELEKFDEISRNIFATGEIPGVYKGDYMPEQSLAVKTENGFTVITGCSHPGIVKILEKIKDNFSLERIYVVFGGFHLRDSSKREIHGIVEKFKEMNVEKAGPTHCSGKKAEEIFKENFGKNFIPVYVGQELEI